MRTVGNARRRVLVSGGDSSAGAALLRELERRGYAADYGEMRPDTEAVVHLGALRLRRPGRERDLVDATAALLARLPSGARLVHAGSTAVYGARAAVARGRQHAAPIRARRWAPRTRRASGWSARATRSVVVRLAPLYGIEDGVVAAARWFAGRGVVPGDGATRVHLLHVDDAAAGLVDALERGEGTYLLAGPHPLTTIELLRAVALDAGLPPAQPRVPGRVARRGAAAYERLHWARHGTPPCTTAEAVDLLTRDRAFSWARAREGLGWEPQVDLAEGLASLSRVSRPDRRRPTFALLSRLTTRITAVRASTVPARRSGPAASPRRPGIASARATVTATAS